MKWATGDRMFLMLVLAITLIGLSIFSSATLGLLAREGSSLSRNILVQGGLGLGLGAICFILGRLVPLASARRYSPYVFAASLIATALVFIPGVGVHVNGATRWISLGFTTVQPAELLKIGCILFLAWWLAPRARQLSDMRRGLLPLLAILALPAGLLLAQPNNSTMILILVSAFAMYFAAGAPWRDFGILAIAVIVGICIIAFARPYVLQRVQTYINPSANSLGSGYHVQQSLIAIGSGGMLGRGLGQSVQKFNYLPEPDGDSVFAVFAEEAGFVGGSLLLLLFFAFAARGIAIAGHAKDLYGGLLALGFSFLIIVQAFINIGAMLGIIPLTGLPLPFVSHGGTALMATLLMCGLILNVAAHRTS